MSASLGAIKAFCNVTEPDWINRFLVTDNDDGTFDPTCTLDASSDLLPIWLWGTGEFGTGENPGSYGYQGVGNKLVSLMPAVYSDITAIDSNGDDLSEANPGLLSNCATIDISDNGMTTDEVGAFFVNILQYADNMLAGATVDAGGTNAAPNAAGLAAIAILAGAPYNWTIIHS